MFMVHGNLMVNQGLIKQKKMNTSCMRKQIFTKNYKNRKTETIRSRTERMFIIELTRLYMALNDGRCGKLLQEEV
jgi:hypothetical protein